jgi:hypothetical protein
VRPVDAGADREATQGWVIQRGDRAEIDRLEPLWKALLEHHKNVYGDLPQRSPDDSWRRRRAEYARWLDGESSFFFVARRGDALLGYVMVGCAKVRWDVRATAELNLMCCRAKRRLGLMNAVDELERLGVEHVLVGPGRPDRRCGSTKDATAGRHLGAAAVADRADGGRRRWMGPT